MERNPFLHPRKRGKGNTAVVVMAAVACFALAAFLFRKQGLLKNLSARMLSSDTAVYFAYISKFDTPKDLTKSVLGFGFAGKLNKGLLDNGKVFQRCRQFFLQTSPKASFEVKVLPAERQLKVVSLLEGADSNGPHAACLRNSLEDLRLRFLSETPEGKDELYRLVIDVVSQISAPVPLN